MPFVLLKCDQHREFCYPHLFALTTLSFSSLLLYLFFASIKDCPTLLCIFPHTLWECTGMRPHLIGLTLTSMAPPWDLVCNIFHIQYCSFCFVCCLLPKGVVGWFVLHTARDWPCTCHTLKISILMHVKNIPAGQSEVLVSSFFSCLIAVPFTLDKLDFHTPLF